MPLSRSPPGEQEGGATPDGPPLNFKELDQLSILDQTSDAIIITDLDGTIVFWNRQAEKLIGIPSKEALGKSIFDAFIPQVDAGLGTEIIGAFNEKGEWDGEVPIQGIDGHRHVVSVTSSLLHDRNDEPIGIIGLGRDITQRKIIERELEQKAEELRRSNEELMRFAYIASHDLREPLRTITAFGSLLEKRAGDQLDERSREYLRFILDGSERMNALIKDLLEYSRVGTAEKVHDKVDMNKVTDQAVRSLCTAIRESGARVEIGELPTIEGDRSQMVQLMQNLISNAIKFHRDREPKVEVSTVTFGDEHVFSIRDNGIGIDPRYQDKLFKMFSRLHTRDEYPGTGIGLAICKKIVERHHGRIWFESMPGRGSTFFFTLPIRNDRS